MKIHTKRWVGTFLCLCLVWGCVVQARTTARGERFVIAEAEELADNPQRYWSRGFVVEDVLESEPGRSRTLGGRSYAQAETRTMGRIYLLERVARSIDEVEVGKTFMFSGTVMSSTSRVWYMPFRMRTVYFITIDQAEAVVDGMEDEWTVLLGEESDRLAIQQVQEILRRAQSQLFAMAQEQGVSPESLIDQDTFRMDKAAEVSRLAVRSVEQEAGTTASELLSLFIREMLASMYLPEETDPVEPDEEPAEAVVTEEDPVDALDAEELPVEEVDREEALGEWVDEEEPTAPTEATEPEVEMEELDEMDWDALDQVPARDEAMEVDVIEQETEDSDSEDLNETPEAEYAPEQIKSAPDGIHTPVRR